MKKIVLLLLFLIPMAFAVPWQTIAMLSVGVSVSLLAIIYMVGYGFGINELQLMAKEEFFQLLVFGLLLVALVSSDSILNAISTSPAFIEGDPTTITMQDTALNIIDQTKFEVINIFGSISEYDIFISQESSKASQCNIMGAGYSVSGCGGFTILASPLSLTGSISGFAIGELSAMKKLIEISNEFALLLLLPLGIILRTLKFTRGAGGLLIALGISLHIMLPIGIIFNDMLAETFIANATASSIYGPPSDPIGVSDLSGCNPSDAAPGLSRRSDSEQSAIDSYGLLRGEIRRYIFTVMIKGMIGPMISLLMVIASIKAITSVAGAEVDVSAISRFV